MSNHKRWVFRNDADYECEITDGPGRYDLFIKGLLEGNSVRFSIRRNGENSKACNFFVRGAWREDKVLDVWIIELQNPVASERVKIYYSPRHKNGYIVEPRVPFVVEMHSMFPTKESNEEDKS